MLLCHVGELIYGRYAGIVKFIQRAAVGFEREVSIVAPPVGEVDPAGKCFLVVDHHTLLMVRKENTQGVLVALLYCGQAVGPPLRGACIEVEDGKHGFKIARVYPGLGGNLGYLICALKTALMMLDISADNPYILSL